MDHKKNIIDRINNIQDLGVLAYLDRFLELFVEKMGWHRVKREYLKKIFKVLSQVNDVWILEQIFKFSVGMTKED